MIKLFTFLVTFFKSNKSKILLIIAFVVAVFGAYRIGLTVGKAIAKQEYTTQQAQQAADALNQFIVGTKELTQAANNASKALTQQIVERKLYDEQSTKALQDALNRSADSRINCVFDDDVLQHIDTARESAVRATTNGITGTTSSAVRTTSKAP